MNSKPVGGLSFTLRPQEQIQIKNSDYILSNRGPVTVRLHLFLKSRVEAIVASTEQQKDQKGNLYVTSEPV